MKKEPMDPSVKTYADGVQDLVTERDRLKVVLDSVAMNLHVRRPDGNKSPLLLAGEEVFRLRDRLAELQEENASLRGRSWQELLTCGGAT